MRFLFTMLAFFIYLPSLSGQNKYEKEYRISSDIVPPSALNYVEKFNFEKKVKWYREENLTLASIEAKTKRNKQRYSIEFDTTGQLQDLEIEIDFETINAPAQKAICDALSQEFDRYKFEKIQQQYAGNAAAILAYFLEEKMHISPEIIIQFEIVLEGKTADKVNLYECTFSQQGSLISKRRIVLRNTDILEY